MNLPIPFLFGLILFATSQGGSPPSISWATLKTLNSSRASSPAKDLDGKRIAVPGFMVPLEDDADQVTEFILVPFAGACIHVPPPPPNQMIYIKLAHNQKVKMSFTDPVLVTGMLHVTTVQSPYGDISFNMDADLVRPYEQ
ncbi:DUF3299 domain-containing protein [Terriglobus albidus]|uniref:DUF3299 domain-containing protein n=1 Tax=Terriglobus albidus TaxID=1592106 RepID=UPI0021E00AB0|nr:DUF3299 domain-containing protein [Terriglobus albidus]